MKILYLSYYFHPDITAAAFRSSDFIEFLEQEKIEYRVITTFPHKSDESVGTDENRIYPLKRVRLKKMRDSKFVSYLLHYLSFIPKAFQIALKWRLQKWKPSIVFISSPPIFIGLLGLMLKWTFGCKLVLEVRDIWPESAVAAGQLSPDGKSYKIARFFEKTLYRKSDGIVCVGKYMKQYISQYTEKEICIAYNGHRQFPPEQKATKNIKNGGQEGPRKIRLAYAGNFGLVQGLDSLIEAFAKLDKVDTEYKWEL
ncbi:MAG: glycosyltransferase family 4 protein, partial [Bacteroidota bacterium]